MSEAWLKDMENRSAAIAAESLHLYVKEKPHTAQSKARMENILILHEQIKELKRNIFGKKRE